MQAAERSLGFPFGLAARFGLHRLTTLWLVLLSAWSLADAQAQTASRPDVVEALHNLVRAQEQAQAQLGLGAAVVFPDGSVWAEGFGCSDVSCRLPILPDHRVGFASITKTYTAALVLQLAGEGRLGLDDRLGDYVGPYTHVNAGITIRQLLGHQSGVYNMTDHPNLETRVWSDLNRRWSPNAILTDFVNPPVFFAGFGARYSNTNYVLLQLVIEAVSGRAYRLELRERLLDPLGLTETFFGPDEDVTGEVPRTWVDLNGDGILEDFTDRNASISVRTIRGASGGMIATTSDIAKWARALFSGLVLAETQRVEMLQFHDLDGVGSVWTGYGLGVQQFNIAGQEMWGHSGLIRGATSLMLYNPKLGYSIALVDNDARSQHFRTAADLVEYLADLDLTSTRSDPPDAAGQFFGLDVYPNPVAAGSFVTLHAPSQGGTAPTAAGWQDIGSETQIRVVDALGRIRMTRGVMPARDGLPTRLSLAGLPSGVYLVTATVAGQPVRSRVLAVR